MGRVLHVRIWGVDDARRDQMVGRFSDLANSREWRSGVPSLAHADSPDFFSMEYFRDAALAANLQPAMNSRLMAATFVRLDGDETDALALAFILRDLSESYGAHVILSDAENPIAKLRKIELIDGRLADGRALEEVMVRRPVFKKLSSGFRIEMFPPQALNFAFGTLDQADQEHRAWSFRIHGMRGSAPTFFEAEAEAMRMYNGLRRFD